MKKSLISFVSSIVILVWLTGCDDQIYPELPSSDPILTIDAWITNLPEPQRIKVAYTQPYFDNNPEMGVTGAQVSIKGSDGTTYDFVEIENGDYVWNPSLGETFGSVGTEYQLEVIHDGITFTSSSSMNRVPEIDSITFRYEKNNFVVGGEMYVAEFWSRDPLGSGDTYWIKTYKNEDFLNKPSEISLAYDAGFSAGGNIDGLVFITPIRESINPYEENEDESKFYSPYEDGDSVYVELHSINEQAFNFLNQVITQTDRPGGFAEFFAKPLSNIDTNITSSNENTKVLGFFSVSAVETLGAKLDITQIPKE